MILRLRKVSFFFHSTFWSLFIFPCLRIFKICSLGDIDLMKTCYRRCFWLGFDKLCSMVSASGGGLAYAFVSKGLKVRPAHALSWAVCYAVASGTMYKVIDWLFMNQYKKSIHIFLLTTGFCSSFRWRKQSEQEVNIPPAPGARLLILDHIKRFVYKLLY